MNWVFSHKKTLSTMLGILLFFIFATFYPNIAMCIVIFVSFSWIIVGGFKILSFIYDEDR